MSIRAIASTIIIALVTSCADTTPPAATDLNERIDRVRDQVWANEPLLGSGRIEDRLPHLEATISNIV